jgi:serine/threonine-protein kinase
MANTAHRRSSVLEGIELPERYEARRRIATGGMASVWCAHDRALGRNVAIKLLSMPFAHDAAAVRRFKREARAAARLSSHSHVVTIYDVGHAYEQGEPLGRPFIVMEFLAGGTVADALRVGEVTPEEAVRWLGQAASALDHAHARGVIHRDIKPANLLLDCDRVLHVADFGIAQLGTDDTFSVTGQVMGTAAYIAPEQVMGRPATEASDRYSLAIAAFELLAGSRPFVADNFAAQGRQHLEHEPPRASERNPKLPRAVDDVLARGMAKDPEDRWPSAGEFAAAVQDTLKAAPETRRRRRSVVAPSATATAALEPRTRRRRPAPAPVGTPERRRPAPVPAATAEGRRLSPLTPVPVRRARRGPALAALAAGVVGIAVAAIASGALGGGSSSSRTASHSPSTSAAKVASTAHAAKSNKHSKPRPATSSTSTTATGSPAAATTPPPTADTLESQGHQLMDAGSYSSAIPVLQKAVAAASPSSLTYAYALYDLGRSLRLSGDPQAAIPVLYKRLQIPNQTEVVRTELQAALRAVGEHYRQSGGAAPPAGPAGPPGHDHGGGPGPGGPGPGGPGDQGDSGD